MRDIRLPNFIEDNIDLPVIVAPMFLVSNDKLVIESCKHGVMGAYPFTNSRTIGELDGWLSNVSEELEREGLYGRGRVAPWVANMIVHSSYKRFDEEIALVRRYKPKVVITALGSPARVVDVVHEYGGVVFADVSNLMLAQKAIKAGVDGLILLTAGAGGHTGYLNPFAFLASVRKFWDGVVILSGCINSAREIKAAQLLGADLCYMGTRFIATEESGASEGYKKMIIWSSIDEVVETKVVTGVSANFLKRSLDEAGVDYKSIVEVAKNISFDERYADNAPKAWKDIWSAGHGVGGIDKVECVEDVINELKRDFEKG